MTNILVRKLRHGAALTGDDERLISSLIPPARSVAAHTELWATGDDEPRVLPVLLDGWACRYRMLENGNRQIVSLIVPGDLAEPFGVLPDFADYSVMTLSSATVAGIAPSALRSAAHGSPTIERALWWDLLMATNIEREHLVSLGRRSAAERLAHLICELHLRLTLVDQVNANTFNLPMTQAELADTLGLSAVHLNRSLQDLRSLGLISLRDRRLTVHDLEGLRQLASFNPLYLHTHSPGSNQPARFRL